MVRTRDKDYFNKKSCEKENTSNKSKSRFSKIDISIKKNGSRKKTTKYSIEQLSEALNALGKGETLREVSKRFNVPKSTLYTKSKYITPLNAKSGPPAALNVNEETDIVNWILYCAEKGFPVTKYQLIDKVHKFITKEQRSTLFIRGRPSQNWYNNFLRRHPHISKKVLHNINLSKIEATEEKIRLWFTHVEQKMKEKNISLADPKKIFFLDKSTFPSNFKDDAESNNQKDCLTVLFMASAAGIITFPMILFDLKDIPKKSVLNQIPDGWGIGYTDKGVITDESIFLFLEKIFLPWLKENEFEFPVALFLEANAAYLTLNISKFCQENRIELIALYPNSKQMFQPLDVAFFPLINKVYTKLLKVQRIIHLRKPMLSKILNKALHLVDLTPSLERGFKETGLFPFDPNVPKYPDSENDTHTIECEPSGSLVFESEESSENDKKRLLKLFETKLISPNTLKSFQEHDEEESWSGNVEEKALFESWCKLRILCGDVWKRKRLRNFKSKNSEKVNSNEDNKTNVNTKNSEKVNGNEDNKTNVNTKNSEKVNSNEDNKTNVNTKNSEKVNSNEDNKTNVNTKNSEKVNSNEDNKTNVNTKNSEKVNSNEDNKTNVNTKNSGKVNSNENNETNLKPKNSEKLNSKENSEINGTVKRGPRIINIEVVNNVRFSLVKYQNKSPLTKSFVNKNTQNSNNHNSLKFHHGGCGIINKDNQSKTFELPNVVESINIEREDGTSDEDTDLSSDSTDLSIDHVHNNVNINDVTEIYNYTEKSPDLRNLEVADNLIDLTDESLDDDPIINIPPILENFTSQNVSNKKKATKRSNDLRKSDKKVQEKKIKKEEVPLKKEERRRKPTERRKSTRCK